jgi:RNA polymerase sigma-70 factor (ECF subfamily)
VRRLARSLVRDEAAADDVEQRTWLAALESPPREEACARSWLARVVRSKVLNAHRSRTRRDAHERRGALGLSQSERSAEDVVALAETQKELVVAVLALGEPYRTTVLLRFFEELPPREVARRMGANVETVRTRTRRALDALRAGLTKRHGGDGWVAALAPLAGIRIETGGPIVATAAGSAAGAAGGAIVGGKVMVAGVAALAVAAGFAGGTLSGTAAPESPAPAAPEVAALRQRIGALESQRQAQPRAARETAAEDAAPPREGRAASPATDGGAAAPLPEDRSAQLEQRIAALEREMAAARAGGGRSAPVDPAAELARLQSLSTEDLLTRMRKLSRTPGKTGAEQEADRGRLMQAAEVLLARNLAPKERAEGLLLQGITQRSIDLDAADATLRESAALAGGYATAEGRGAYAHLAFVAMARDDSTSAADQFMALGRRPEAPADEQVKWRSFGAGIYGKKDAERSRAAYQAIVDEFGASEDEAVRSAVAALARRPLADLDRIADARRAESPR